MAIKTLIEAVREGMHEEIQRDERVFILGQDIGRRGGVFLATDKYKKKWGRPFFLNLEDFALEADISYLANVKMGVGNSLSFPIVL